MVQIIHLKNKVMPEAECLELLHESRVGRLGTSGSGGLPYLTPLNFAFEPETRKIYAHHSGKGGRLLDNLRVNNRACFEVESAGDIVNIAAEYDICDGDQPYRSVICEGRVSFAAGDEKVRGLRLLGAKYTAGKPVSSQNTIPPNKLDRLVVLVFSVEKVVGKVRSPRSVAP
jgi:nitroimidazol reductase NimA-like FMN-containing flavoprotein (pyridoxamine 5'-phosphate oxidase superfamily)